LRGAGGVQSVANDDGGEDNERRSCAASRSWSIVEDVGNGQRAGEGATRRFFALPGFPRSCSRCLRLSLRLRILQPLMCPLRAIFDLKSCSQNWQVISQDEANAAEGTSEAPMAAPWQGVLEVHDAAWPFLRDWRCVWSTLFGAGLLVCALPFTPGTSFLCFV